MSLDSGHKVPGTAHGFMNQGGGQDVVFERAVEAEMQKQLAAIRQSQEQHTSLQSTARPHLPPAHHTQPHLSMRHSGKRNTHRVCWSLREARVFVVIWFILFELQLESIVFILASVE